MNSCGYVLINQTTDATANIGGALTLPLLEQMSAALEEQLNAHLSAEWGGNYVVRPGKDENDLTASEVPVYIKDFPPQAGVGGYHDRQPNGLPIIYVFKGECQTMFSGAWSLSAITSHELCEGSVDAPANLWADRGDGTEEALEVSDRVQGTYYAIGAVSVANFLYKGAFDPGFSGKYDYLGVLTSQSSETPQGYTLLRTASDDYRDGTKPRPGFGAAVVGGRHMVYTTKDPAPEVRARKMLPHSRTFRRGVRYEVAT